VSDKCVEDAIYGQPGQIMYLSWVINNDGKKSWPRYPILKNVTTSQNTLQYIPANQYTKDELIKTKLNANAEFELHYKFELPKDLPTAVFILKFQMIDPLCLNQLMQDEDNNYTEKDLLRHSKFGDVLSVTIQVEGGNMGQLQGARQSEMRGMPGLFASIDSNREDEITEEYGYEEPDGPDYKEVDV